MEKLFGWVFLICSVCMAVSFAHDWYEGAPADFALRMFAILYCVHMATDAIQSLAHHE